MGRVRRHRLARHGLGERDLLRYHGTFTVGYFKHPNGRQPLIEQYQTP
jgi:hypothetical protein